MLINLQQSGSFYEKNKRGFRSGNFLLKIFFFLCLIPFFSPAPLHTDIQPLFAVVGFVTAYYFAIKHALKIDFFTLIFIMFAYVFMLNYNFEQPNGVVYHIRKSIGLFFAVPILLIFSRYFNLLSNRLMLCVLSVYLLGAIVQVFLPSLYYGIFSHFFNNKVVELGLRGWKSFSPEPINLAFTCIAIICLAMASNKVHAITNKQKKIITFVCVFIILGSLNATGIIALAVIGGIAIVNKLSIKYILFISLFIIVPTTITHEYLYENIRSFRLLIDLASNPLYVIETTSLFYRVFHNVVAFLYYFDQPTFSGLGVASFDIAAKHVVEVYNIANHFPFRAEFISDGYYGTFGSESKNMLSQLIIEHGALGILFYSLCLLYILSNWSKNLSIYILTYFVIASIQSTPMVFPLIWVLLAVNTFVFKQSKITRISDAKI